MPKLTAVTGKAIITLEEPEDTFAGGLIIPEAHRRNNTFAIVVSSGIDDVEPGDRVVISGEYAGAGFHIDGVEYVTVLAEEILALVEE